MKNSTKNGLVAFGVLTAGTLAWSAYQYKKSMKKTVKARKSDHEQLRKVGIDLGKVEESDKASSSVDRMNLSKNLRVGFEFDPSIDTDIFNSDKAIDNPETTIIVSDRRTDLDMLFEVPVIGNYPFVGDYLTDIGKFIEEELAEVREDFPYVDKPFRCLEGYLFLQGENDEGDIVAFTQKVTKNLYSHIKSERGDGLSEYITNMKSGNFSSDGSLEFEECPRKDLVNLKLVDAKLYVKLSFSMANVARRIDLTAAKVILGKMITELEVVNHRNNLSQRFDHVLFLAPDDQGNENLFSFYDTDENRDIIIDSYEY